MKDKGELQLRPRLQLFLNVCLFSLQVTKTEVYASRVHYHLWADPLVFNHFPLSVEQSKRDQWGVSGSLVDQDKRPPPPEPFNIET